MTDALAPSVTVLIKLGSLAAHAEEMFATGISAPGAARFDMAAIEGLLADPEVKEWMQAARAAALLPVPR